MGDKVEATYHGREHDRPAKRTPSTADPATLNEHGERIHMAWLRLYVVAVHRPITRHVLPLLTRLLGHPRP